MLPDGGLKVMGGLFLTGGQIIFLHVGKSSYLCRRKNLSFMGKTILIVLAVAVAVVALMMAGLGLKMLLHKEKEFRRPCTNADPKTGRCTNCTCDLKKGKRTNIQ